MRAVDTTYGVHGTFNVVRCRHCGLVYTDPRPTREAIGIFYPTDYRPHSVDSREHQNPLGQLARRVAFSGKSTRLGQLYNHLAFRAFAPGGEGRRVLDVGCGVGAYLDVWRSLGWEIEGLEPDEDAARVAEERLNVTIHRGFAEEADLPLERYDLITFSHTLEHFHAPTDALRHLRTSLIPGGRVLIMVPNFSAWLRRLTGSRWLGLEVPRHLYHFEPKTLAAILDVAGYHDIRVAGSAHPGVLLKHLQNLLGGRLDPKGAWGLSGALALLRLPQAMLRRTDLLWATATS